MRPFARQRHRRRDRGVRAEHLRSRGDAGWMGSAVARTRVAQSALYIVIRQILGGHSYCCTSLTDLLQLDSPPIAIAFVDQAPPGVPHVSAMEPAGCGYWRRAAAGEVFFTVADDHKRCPVGRTRTTCPLGVGTAGADGAGGDDGRAVVPEAGGRAADSKAQDAAACRRLLAPGGCTGAEPTWCWCAATPGS